MSNRRGPETWARGPSIAEQCWHEPTPPAELDAMAARVIRGRVARGLYTPEQGQAELARLGLEAAALVVERPPCPAPIAREIAAYRDAHALTWRQMERATGCPANTLRRIALGRMCPRPALVARIRAALEREAA